MYVQMIHVIYTHIYKYNKVDICIYIHIYIYNRVDIYVYMCVCVCVKLIHFAIHLKLTQHCKLTMLQ